MNDNGQNRKLNSQQPREWIVHNLESAILSTIHQQQRGQSSGKGMDPIQHSTNT